jgi:hypothetical protein
MKPMPTLLILPAIFLAISAAQAQILTPEVSAQVDKVLIRIFLKNGYSSDGQRSSRAKECLLHALLTGLQWRRR